MEFPQPQDMNKESRRQVQAQTTTRVLEISLEQLRVLVDDGSVQVIRISHGGNKADDCVRPRHVHKEAFLPRSVSSGDGYDELMTSRLMRCGKALEL